MNKRVTVKVAWSGGKDSTCAVMRHIAKGHQVKAVCYVPMFTKSIPLILKDHYEFIQETAAYFRSLGAEVHIVSGMTYYDYVTHRAKQGRFKGKIFGFPYLGCGQCGFKRDSKLKAILAYDVGAFDYEEIAIAADETRRQNQLNGMRRSILQEEGITEADAKEFCREHGILSPQYEKSGRDGCVLCPNAKDAEIARWLSDYPEARPLLHALQEYVKIERPDRDPPRRGYHWFIEAG